MEPIKKKAYWLSALGSDKNIVIDNKFNKVLSSSTISYPIKINVTKLSYSFYI